MTEVVSFEVRTSRRVETVDLTSRVREAVSGSGVREGVGVVFVPHTTAGVTINENADPDVTHDAEGALAGLVPRDARFRHAEGNSDAHIKASLVGSSVTFIIHDGAPLLGTWQGIHFCEFDGPRSRTVRLKCVEG